jgi:hypothetical protein
MRALPNPDRAGDLAAHDGSAQSFGEHHGKTSGKCRRQSAFDGVVPLVTLPPAVPSCYHPDLSRGCNVKPIGV